MNYLNYDFNPVRADFILISKSKEFSYLTHIKQGIFFINSKRVHFLFNKSYNTILILLKFFF